MSDPFQNYQTGLTAPATDLIEISPSDSADLDTHVRGICATRSGSVRVTTVGGTTATIFVVAGAIWPVRARRVWATGTDASGIVGLV